MLSNDSADYQSAAGLVLAGSFFECAQQWRDTNYSLDTTTTCAG